MRPRRRGRRAGRARRADRPRRQAHGRGHGSAGRDAAPAARVPARHRRFARNEHAPIEADLVVVDECSMLDLPLAYQVLRAVGPETRLVFVGDVDQLPSVGPGRVLADIVASGLVPVARLDQVFRQGEGSRIVANAHRVRRGELPRFPADDDPDPDRDCFFVETRDAGRALDLATRIVCERIPAAYGLDPLEDVQVLAPMYRGPLGVDALNRALGDRLVPGGPEVQRGGHRYRVGDKVLAVQNDYELELFNGDPGRLLALDDEAGRARLRFGGRVLELPYEELDRVVPAYAITVHRAQGTEYPAVVLALDRGHYMLLYRRLLYTAMTRARRLLVLVGSRWALEQAVGNDREGDRCTGLADRLRQRAVGDGVHPERDIRPK
ncbi:MAG: AAA family ATPase [Planctomycetota bacterium]